MALLRSTAIDACAAHDGDRIDVCQYGCVRQIPTLAPSCPPLLAEPLGAAEAGALSGALKALADPARLRLLSLIHAQPSHEACVCHLTEPLGLSQPTVSHHLRVLLEAGLVEREQRGSWAFYRAVPEALATLSSLLGPEPRGRAKVARTRSSAPGTSA
jgi:ArsR family transcriptional regulator